MARETLNREQIVRAAIELLDAEGIEGLSMRKLGQRLGSAATAMYWHVGNKENLLVLAADEVWSEVRLPDVAMVGWRTAARELMYAARELCDRHRWLVRVITSYAAAGEGLARFQERAYETFEAAGFRDADLDWAVSTPFMFVTGLAIMSSSDAAEVKKRAEQDAAAQPEQEAQAVAHMNALAAKYPRLGASMAAQAQRGQGFVEQVDEVFAFGVETILDGLTARLAGRSEAV
ncbi:TetR/AcrR family transcriptional regulator C-terminal domain-containing protein [Streptomyces sp. ISL-22]|uniref:TetR/AcrR family transcriptional regulator C-terminal domain-containing protein n=1 Tax=unclassified Streptomyces TaxID=2593676 RepID=UPI001BEA210D|nr:MULTISPECIES: TetR/AcrR family transcriptional regulator C-terminal domain-containing protein [unclassified Streptomyces]MBT2418599.1 TetR/AcrR family transcriptional regulator C-terminal domain-containing protein [Streptomyces sp. ISL-24]MBT2434298.1 TetR/AcrR family transcriptional regulator C-terminal domain-containing protein [Streptomyces sp. ISL-22]